MESIINRHAPEFTVQAYQNGSFKTVSNKDIEGKWALFFFYPADFTFVCPTELEDLQSKYAELQSMGVEVFGVSTDSHFVHKAWHDTSYSGVAQRASTPQNRAASSPKYASPSLI